jgi:hypothetical protein
MNWKFLFLMALAGLAGLSRGLAEDATPAAGADLAPLPLVLPSPAVKGTPPNLPTNTTAEPLSAQPRPVFFAPKGVANAALQKGHPLGRCVFDTKDRRMPRLNDFVNYQCNNIRNCLPPCLPGKSRWAHTET